MRIEVFGTRLVFGHREDKQFTAKSGLLRDHIRLIIGCAALLAACHDPPTPLTPADIERLTQGQAEVLLVDGEHVTLEGLEAFYLGMSQQDADAAIATMCTRAVELNGGAGRELSFFKGCLTPQNDTFYTFRVGFNKSVNNRVFTLETKRHPTDLKLVRARFYQRFPGVRVDLPKRGTLMMETPDYNLFADIDEGKEGPTHVLIGLSDAMVAKLKP